MFDILRHIFFEDPLTLWILFGIGAILAAAVWSRTGSWWALVTGGALVAAAVVVGLVAWLVDTDYERLVRSVNAIGRAVETGNVDAFIERISPEYQNGPFRKEDLAEAARKAMPLVRATPRSPQRITWNDTATEATVTVQYIFSRVSGKGPGEGEIAVTWEGKFAPDPDSEWRLRSAMAIHPDRIAPESAARHFWH
jgi:hypothetical protein